MRLVQRLQPDLTIHYHQPYGVVVRGSGVDLALARRYAARSGLPLRALPPYRGTVAGWQNARDAGSALVVELGAGAVPERAGERHAAAALAVARLLVARGS
jgi:protein MpaA